MAEIIQEPGNRILAVDASPNGRWIATGGRDGRVRLYRTEALDQAPTVLDGLVLFGCRDGSVYCLRATDGELVWRFRAAPDDRRVVSYGQIESVWPVHGSVLVQDGMVYFAAGRSSFLDGGIIVYALDAKTGSVHRAVCCAPGAQRAHSFVRGFAIRLIREGMVHPTIQPPATRHPPPATRHPPFLRSVACQRS